jgi:hypothetical protein
MKIRGALELWYIRLMAFLALDQDKNMYEVDGERSGEDSEQDNVADDACSFSPST